RVFPDCDLTALVEAHPERRLAMARQYEVPHAYASGREMLRELTPDLVSVVTPTRYTPGVVIQCAGAGVRAITAEKPVAGWLSHCDLMLAACRASGVLFSGGNLQRALPEVQETAGWLREGRLGCLEGAALRLGRELSGGGVQGISILRLFLGCDAVTVQAWASAQQEAREETDLCTLHGWIEFENGIRCLVAPDGGEQRGLEVWGSRGAIRWDWGPPTWWSVPDAAGFRRPWPVEYSPYPYPELGYLGSALRSVIGVLRGEAALPLAISGEDLCIALEIALALKVSARRGGVPVRLPLQDRAQPLIPVPYRWLGGDTTGYRYPDGAGTALEP
ncbi:MAG: Gfo/Idh/MocA family oxidoreductase, partial [Armatimonadetes bacterium]|nr:Gfo/Idh/MocA family oxidoreductase [Armatimonadota bacterium]